MRPPPERTQQCDIAVTDASISLPFVFQRPPCEAPWQPRRPCGGGGAPFAGTVKRSPLASLRLMDSSNFVDCCTGNSAGFSPLRMRPTYAPHIRYASAILGP